MSRTIIVSWLFIVGCGSSGAPSTEDPETICEEQQRVDATLAINPVTGQCEERGPSSSAWASCCSSCNELDASTCTSDPNCRPVYLNDESHDGGPQFWDCWALAEIDPALGDCRQLDAMACSTRSDCAAVHEFNSQRFSFCRSEPATF